MAKKKRSGILLKQQVAVGIGATIFVGILIYLFTVVLKDAPLGEFVAGDHYELLEEPRRIRGDKIEIMEFFSYGCIHCYNFDPELESWVKRQGDRISFIRTPAIASEQWRVLGRAWYAMEELNIVEANHYALFRAIHDANLDLSSMEKVAQWIDGRSVTADEFTEAYNSPSVASKVRLADQMARRMRIATVPTIIVNGKYRVRITRTIGPSRMLDVMDHLVEKEEQPPATGD